MRFECGVLGLGNCQSHMFGNGGINKLEVVSMLRMLLDMINVSSTAILDRYKTVMKSAQVV